MAEDFPGSQRFEVLSRLGQGGMGVVYAAYDRERRQQVALKTLLVTDARSLMLFKSEFRVLQDLRHPNLVRLGELFEENGRLFFTMEWVEGEPFVRYIQPLTDGISRGPVAATERSSSDATAVATASATAAVAASGSLLPMTTQADRSAARLLASGSQPLAAALAATAAGEERQAASPPRAASTALQLGATVADARPLLISSLDATLPDGGRPGPLSPPPPAVAPPDEPELASSASGYACDETRLRAALGQLCQVLAYVHAAGKVHRDVKPSNILITPEERVVLLDFGIAIELDPLASWGEARAVGTAAYMAPEQIGRGAVGPAADWYSVGVMIYQALSGRLPFNGSLREVLDHKLHQPAPPVQELVRGSAPDLEQLCMDLLERDPARRPSGPEILERLRAGVSAPEMALSQRRVFVGRDRELAALRQAFDDVGGGRGVTLLVAGESGVGKSALVRTFLRQLRAASPESLVLAGRCYERESLPYKALDDIIDHLSQYLQHLPAETLRVLLPEQLRLLVTLFPVLGPLRAQSPAEPELPSGYDPVEQRRGAFAALRQLIQRIGELVPLVLYIDDLQWADADSFVLLGELLREPMPRLLLLATIRTATPPSDGVSGDRLPPAGDPAGEPPADPAAAIARRLPAPVRTLRVEQLAAADARQLAERLLEGFSAGSPDRAELELIVQEAQGHPLYIDELVRVRLLRGRTEPASRPLRLDDALWWRIEQMPAGARRLMELLAVAGRPMRQDLVELAAGLPAGPFDDLTSLLRAAHLARTSGSGRGDAIEPYHDRVRESVLAHLDAPTLGGWHRQLAQTLEAAGTGDAEQLLLHWRGAGEPGRAIGYALRAAEQAERALAFDHAVELYRAALALSAQAHRDESARRDLQVRLGVALGNAGRGAESGHAFLAAAATAPPEQRRELQCRAASQLMRSGHLDEGTDHLREALRAVGLKLPRSPQHTLLLLLWRRAQLTLRGLHYQERPERPLSAEERARLDACRIAASGLAMSDVICGAMFQSHYVLLALQSGDLNRIAIGLTIEAAFRAGAGGPGWKQTRKVLDLGQALAERLGDPCSLGNFHLNCGIAHHLIGRFDVAAEELRQAEALLRRHGVDISWELNTCKLFASFNDVYLGRLGRLGQRLPQLIAEAEQRDDLYSLTNYRVCPWPMVCLALDRPDDAQAVAEASLRRWSSRGFHLEHYNTMQVLAQTEIYRGEGRAALRRAEAGRTQARSALLLQVQNVRIEIADLVGQAALAAALEAPADARRYLKRAEREARRLEGEGMDWSLAMAARLRAAVAAARGEREQALALLRSAIERFAKVPMAMYEAAARLRYGQLLGGDAGQAEQRRAEAAMAAEGVVAPVRFAGLLAPGFPA